MQTKGERMRSEANVSNDTAVAASKEGAKTFRNNVGGAWTGIKQDRTPDGRLVPKGYTLLRNARWIDFGLQKGSADRIGWVPVKITPEMVGEMFARFLSLEIKREDGRARKEQVIWHDIVTRDGGLSGFIRNADDVRDVIAGRSIDP